MKKIILFPNVFSYFVQQITEDDDDDDEDDAMDVDSENTVFGIMTVINITDKQVIHTDVLCLWEIWEDLIKCMCLHTYKQVCLTHKYAHTHNTKYTHIPREHDTNTILSTPKGKHD